MSERGFITRRKLLAVAAVVEIGTGLALVLTPALVFELLLGSELPVAAGPLGRVTGIALLAFGLTCWPGGPPAGSQSAARGMLVYNGLVALYLGFLGAVGQGGILLWPAVVLHAFVAVLLIWTSRRRGP